MRPHAAAYPAYPLNPPLMHTAHDTAPPLPKTTLWIRPCQNLMTAGPRVWGKLFCVTLTKLPSFGKWSGGHPTRSPIRRWTQRWSRLESRCRVDYSSPVNTTGTTYRMTYKPYRPLGLQSTIEFEIRTKSLSSAWYKIIWFRYRLKFRDLWLCPLRVKKYRATPIYDFEAFISMAY